MKMKKNSGITLVALVVTIVVLLILAGITITALFSDNGIITKAKKSLVETEVSGVKEEFILAMNNYQIEKYEGYEDGLMAYLYSKRMIGFQGDYENRSISVLTYNLKSCKNTGKGSWKDKKDVYIIEKDGCLRYYYEDGTSKVLIDFDKEYNPGVVGT